MIWPIKAMPTVKTWAAASCTGSSGIPHIKSKNWLKKKSANIKRKAGGRLNPDTGVVSCDSFFCGSYSIAVAEAQHEKRYVELAGNIKADRVFKREQAAKWHCLNCGYGADALEAPEICPACAHPQAYFELLRENW